MLCPLHCATIGRAAAAANSAVPRSRSVIPTLHSSPALTAAACAQWPAATCVRTHCHGRPALSNHTPRAGYTSHHPSLPLSCLLTGLVVPSTYRQPDIQPPFRYTSTTHSAPSLSIAMHRSSPSSRPLLPLLSLAVLLSLLVGGCHGWITIGRVTGCPRNENQVTYECEAGMTVTITSPFNDFLNWNTTANFTWGMTVDQSYPCSHCTFISAFQVACNLPELPADMTRDPKKSHNLDVRYNTTAHGGQSAGTTVFYGSVNTAGSSSGGSDDGANTGSTLFGLSLPVAVAVLVVAALVLLAVVGVLLWLCRGRLSWGAGRSDEEPSGMASYGTLE